MRRRCEIILRLPAASLNLPAERPHTIDTILHRNVDRSYYGLCPMLFAWAKLVQASEDVLYLREGGLRRQASGGAEFRRRLRMRSRFLCLYREIRRLAAGPWRCSNTVAKGHSSWSWRWGDRI